QYNAFIKNNHRLWAQAENDEISTEDVFSNRFNLPFLKNCGVSAMQLDDRFQEMQQHQSTPTKGALACCQALSAKIDLYTASNGKQLTQATRVQGSVLAPYLKQIFTSESVKTLKPKPEFFAKILQEIGCADLQKVLMVGDTYSEDIVGATNFGIDSCWLNLKQTAIPKSQLCTYQIFDLGQLPALIM
ncbi:HAD family hydrolase, partial [Lactobacillus sp. XV13L]|nr:HAD family hydrolase [Lactobacillus sp. XV13L]